MMKLSADKRSMRNPGARSSSSWSPPLSAPPRDQLEAAAAVLNAGSRIAVLAGQGALSARDEVTQLADTIGAPVAKALLGKAVLPDDSPFTTGGIGDLGTAPSSWAMQNCDTVLILGSTMPWEEYYPKPGQARGVQVDLKPDRLGPALPGRDRSYRRRQGNPARLDPAAHPQERPKLFAGSAAPDGGLEWVARQGRGHAAIAAAPAIGDPRAERPAAG
jgi:hypothetical protein